MQIEWYRGYQIRLMFWDESFFVCWKKKEMKLNKKNMVVIRFMLFSLFFGAGNLIFPPFLGQNAGEHTFTAMAGFLLTAVVLPVFGDGGAILLAAIFTLACLTTCVGLINSISQFFSILFKNFVEIYLESMEHRIKENALMTKQNIFYHHIVPYLGEMKLDEITPKDIIHWQDQVMKDNNYKQTYLKTIHNQLSALFNYAVRFYGLKNNPARLAGNMGIEEVGEMKFWTKEEYLTFSRSMMNKEESYHAFEILYWCGIRLGELLALTAEDFDFEKKTLRINKSYQHIKGKDVITTPKTRKSNRVLTLPDFLAEEMQDYISRLPYLKVDDRIFTITKSGLHHEIDRGCRETGVKRIRIHDLRHSHASLLISMGENPLLIKERLGHEKIQTTLGTYGHLYPNTNLEVAKKLTGILQVQSATESIANYTSNQHTAIYHRTVEEK